MRQFCTYFDINYLGKGLALYRSLIRHCPSFTLWILCLDDAVQQTLRQLDLPHIQLLTLAELETASPELLEAKTNRSRVEYYFTCTPALCRHLLKHVQEIDTITYLDADLMFFADPAPLFDEMGEHSVLIIPHRFPARNREFEKYGLYNVQMLVFRDDERGIQCLDWWYEQCLEWCYDYLDGDRYADQKYLDVWPQKFEGVWILQHQGGGLAPWNANNEPLTIRDNQIMVGDDVLIFYHYHGLRRLARWVYQMGLSLYSEKATAQLVNYVYLPYITELRAIETWLHNANLTTRYLPTKTRIYYSPWILLNALRKPDILFIFGLRGS